MNRRTPGSLQAAVFAVAGLLFAVPVLDAVATAWPIRAGDLTWRVGVVSLYGQAILTPLLGTAIWVVAAAAFERSSLARLGSAVAILLATTSLAAILALAWDFPDARSRVADEVRASYDLAGIATGLKLALESAAAGLMSLGGLKAAGLSGASSSRGGASRIVSAVSTRIADR